VREAFQSNGVAIVDGGLDGFGERGNTRHRDGIPVASRIYGWPPAGSNGRRLEVGAPTDCRHAGKATHFHDFRRA
jgi:hypothetical protein